MGRSLTITYEQAATIADQMTARGEKPNATNVRKVHGSGCLGTITSHLRLWEADQLNQNKIIGNGLDLSIVRAISTQIAKAVQEAIADKTAQLADLQVKIDILIADNDHQYTDLELQTKEFAALQDQHLSLVGRLHQLEIEAIRNAASLVAERAATESARVGLAKAELRLEAVPKIEAEVEKVREELLESRTQAANYHEVAAVATAKFEAEISHRKNIEVQLTEAVLQRKEASNRAKVSAEALSNERVR